MDQQLRWTQKSEVLLPVLPLHHVLQLVPVTVDGGDFLPTFGVEKAKAAHESPKLPLCVLDVYWSIRVRPIVWLFQLQHLPGAIRCGRGKPVRR